MLLLIATNIYGMIVINQLREDDYIRDGNHPSRKKSVSLTLEGIEFAKKLLEKYNISDREE
jgi:hypothetical protein